MLASEEFICAFWHFHPCYHKQMIKTWHGAPAERELTNPAEAKGLAGDSEQNILSGRLTDQGFWTLTCISYICHRIANKFVTLTCAYVLVHTHIFSSSYMYCIMLLLLLLVTNKKKKEQGTLWVIYVVISPPTGEKATQILVMDFPMSIASSTHPTTHLPGTSSTTTSVFFWFYLMLLNTSLSIK